MYIPFQLFSIFRIFPLLLHTIRYNQPRAVELTAVEQQRLTVIATDDGASIEHIGAFASATGHLLAVAGERQRLQALAVGTAAVVGHGAVEVRTADDESRLVAASQLERAVVLVVAAYNNVFRRRSRLVACDIDVTHCRAAVALGRDADIHAGTLDGCEGETRRVQLVLQHEVTGIATTVGIVAFTSATQKRHNQSK